jgi:hypothetical protein
MRADLSFTDGRTARLQCDMLSPALFRSFLFVRGDAGSLAVLNPYHPHYINWLTVRGRQGRRSEFVRGENAYVLQLRAFIAAIRGEAELNTGPADAIGNMRLIDAIYEGWANAEAVSVIRKNTGYSSTSRTPLNRRCGENRVRHICSLPPLRYGMLTNSCRICSAAHATVCLQPACGLLREVRGELAAT